MIADIHLPIRKLADENPEWQIQHEIRVSQHQRGSPFRITKYQNGGGEHGQTTRCGLLLHGQTRQIKQDHYLR
ncbi:hypothetical protein A7S44_21605 [Salmonella enterica]|nr:hypothetical protein SEEE3402_19035 [Salmonella enterica subsp. enterica serovar Enteritidis str. 3402]OHJ18702.1 hypothetical protein A7S44_21605 [Salmonella enterica]